MSLLHVTIIAILLVSSPPTITCSRHRLDNHQSTEQVADRQPLRPARDDLAWGEFAKWVKRIGEKHMRKQAMRAKAKNNPQLLNLDPSIAEPDLSGNYPGMKQYLDWESVVSSATYIIVDQNGLGQFTGISAALDSIPSDIFRRYRITIQVNAGIYREKVYIGKDKPFITMVGIGNPVIVWDDNKVNANNRTFESATFGVGGDFFMAVNMTFQNSAPAPQSGAVGMQAVALRITSDVAVFYRCSILGNQDSLYDHNGRHYFKECFIQGSIDFIFGDGLSIYYRCELNVVPTSSGALTAQKRQNATDNSGFSFLYCWITGGAGQVYLGRAWGPFSRVVYSFTWMNDIIYAPGWYDWGNYTRQATVYYGQYKCTGPGANQAGRVAWSHELTDWEVVPFLSLSFVDGEAWIPQYMRPVEGGL